MRTTYKAIALEARLRGCNNVKTLGVRTNFSDYSPEEARLIRSADKIYYPTTFYADLFDAMGKATFPSYHTYKCVQDKIMQTALFELLELPQPKTRVFYGNRQKKAITDYFAFPFIAKIPRGSAMGRGVFLINNNDELHAYLKQTGTAYIQQYLPVDRDIRIVVIGDQIVHAYWRISAPDEFRTNISLGGVISLEPIPQGALNLALEVTRSCRWNDVGIDICEYEGQFFLLEANMKYGKEGFRKAGIDYIKLMESLIENEQI
jgi:ribosomal protein S6--L-glutamate ligase